MPEGNVAMDFFYNLSSRYQEFKSQFTNDVNQGKIAVPATLADMYSMANKFVPTVRTVKPSTSSVFKTQIDDQDDQGSVTQKSKKMDKQQMVNCGKDAKKDDGTSVYSKIYSGSISSVSKRNPQRRQDIVDSALLETYHVRAAQ